MRIGYLDYSKEVLEIEEVKRIKVKERFEKVVKINGKVVERFVLVSDDFIMYFWDLIDNGNKLVVRLLGY